VLPILSQKARKGGAPTSEINVMLEARGSMGHPPTAASLLPQLFEKVYRDHGTGYLDA